MSTSSSRRADAGPPALGAGVEAGAEVGAGVGSGAGVDLAGAGAAAGAGVGFAGSGALEMTGLLGFSSCRAAVTAGRCTGFGTSSKLDALSLSEASSLSTNLEAPAASESLLSFIDGGGPREAMGAGADACTGFGGSVLVGDGCAGAAGGGL
jgi:hypothetical protein